MTKVVVIGALPESLINFRGDLLKKLVDSGHEVICMAAEADSSVLGQLDALGVVFRMYPVQRTGINPLKDMQTFVSLCRSLRQIRPDVVLSYTIKPIIWGGMALKGLTRTRFYALVTGMGFAFQSEDSRLRKFLSGLVTGLYRVALSKATCVIFQNRDNKNFFVSRNIVEKNRCAVVNGSGVDLFKFAVQPLPEDSIVFLTIGRLLRAKGFREYALAAQIVKKRYPKAVFRLLGPSDPSPDGIPDNEVKGWDANGCLEYLGATNDVRPFIAGCHIFVLASHHEGMPRTVLEAMAMGRPILTTDVPGCRETVIPGENGYLVPKSDVVALAERMSWFIEHRDEWNRMGLRSRAMAEERFDVHEVSREMLKIMNLLH